MKKYLSILFNLTLLIAFTDSYALKVMTYNIRRMGDDTPEFQWDNRKHLVFNEVLSQKPTIIGFQEVVKGQQYDDLAAALSDYKFFGEDRNKYATGWWQKWVIKNFKAQNECSPIFYDPKKVELIESGTMGINPAGYFSYATLPRICTWGLFKDKDSGKEFYFYNTHLSTNSLYGMKDGTERIRNKQVKIILKHFKKGKKDIPAIILGDFNTSLKGEILKIFNRKGFIAAKDIAKELKGPQETRTGWNNAQLKTIDHIMVKDISVEAFEVIQNKEGKYPSDHRPVAAEIILSGK